MDGIEVLVREFEDFRHLLAAYDEVGAQRHELTRYADRWVCDREGFEPSPACVLRPLAEAMDVVRAGFEELADEFGRRWATHREAVAASERALHAAEHEVVHDLRRLAQRLEVA
ncbi:MAG: hypothetical protein ACR2K3_10120 [Nocardioides sp.]